MLFIGIVTIQSVADKMSLLNAGHINIQLNFRYGLVTFDDVRDMFLATCMSISKVRQRQLLFVQEHRTQQC